MDEDRLMKEVLDKFVNCHEQTYEEFLSTFTYLSKEIAVTKGGRHGTSSSENTFTSVKVSPKNESNGDHHRNTTISVCTASQSSEEDQIAIHAGQEVSSSVQGGRRPAGKVKVNSFLDLEDLDMDEERKPQMSMDALLLPGQVEQDVSTGVPAHVPCVDQPLTSEVKPKPTVERKQKHTEEILGDEVQPFSLDEEFDYENVALTPKFSFEEIETIKESSNQKGKDTNLD